MRQPLTVLLQHYMSTFVLKTQAVMAIGDGGNDLPLLQSVGLGVAMGNAVPQVCLLCYCTTSANV